jgi:hypothetical protein
MDYASYMSMGQVYAISEDTPFPAVGALISPRRWVARLRRLSADGLYIRLNFQRRPACFTWSRSTIVTRCVAAKIYSSAVEGRIERRGNCPVRNIDARKTIPNQIIKVGSPSVIYRNAHGSIMGASPSGNLDRNIRIQY